MSPCCCPESKKQQEEKIPNMEEDISPTGNTLANENPLIEPTDDEVRNDKGSSVDA